MAVTATRVISIAMAQEVIFEQEFEAVENQDAPGVINDVELSAGANTITVPDGATGVTIVPRSTNTATLTLKGVSGDTGIALALTSPTSIGLATVTSFVITASAITNVRFIFT